MPSYSLGIDIGGTFTDNKIMEGAFIWAPLRIIGATGSPGNPMVLY